MAQRRPTWQRVGAAALALIALSTPTAPAAAADIPWPDGLDPDVVRAATVGEASISAGDAHTCAVTSLGQVYCWGENGSGQLGDDNAPDDSATAVPAIGELTGVAVQVAAGGAHTCALDLGGAVHCWGDNAAGQLGIGAGPDEDAPVLVEALAERTMVEVTAGAAHTCAIDDQGGAWCWGDNSAGQLGVPGAPATADTPTAVSTLTGMTDPVVDIAAGADTTCAMTVHGAAYCWGSDASGQLGDDAALADHGEPVPVATDGVLNGVQVHQLDVGAVQSCALGSAGWAACWGENADGALGEAAGVNDPRPEPVAVDTSGVLAGVQLTQVSAGGRHTCALAGVADAYCWGSDSAGQLGDNPASSDRDVPVRVAAGARTGDSPLRDIAAGDRHTCVLDEEGRAYCWGADDSGQLGNATAGASGIPVLVQGLPRPPHSVTHLRITPIAGGLRVRWTPPTDFGSGSFVFYLAVTAGMEAGCLVQTASGTGCDLTGLTAGRSYGVAVLVLTTDGAALSEFVDGVPKAVATGGGGAGLPVTGPGLGAYLVTGVALLALGAAIVWLTRQRAAGRVSGR